MNGRARSYRFKNTGMRCALIRLFRFVSSAVQLPGYHVRAGTSTARSPPKFAKTWRESGCTPLHMHSFLPAALERKSIKNLELLHATTMDPPTYMYIKI